MFFLENPGLYSKVVFDHTSILKTILVHNRNRIPQPILASFGARVNQANHLGMAMDIDQTMPRPKNQLLKELRNLKRKTKANNLSKRRSGINNYYKRHAEIDPQDYHESLRKLYMPK